MSNIIEFAQRMRNAANTPQASEYCIEASVKLLALSEQFNQLKAIAEATTDIETFVDENGRTWRRPTVQEYAYAVRMGETWRDLALMQGDKLNNIRTAIDEFKHTVFKLPAPPTA